MPLSFRITISPGGPDPPNPRNTVVFNLEDVLVYHPPRNEDFVQVQTGDRPQTATVDSGSETPFYLPLTPQQWRSLNAIPSQPSTPDQSWRPLFTARFRFRNGSGIYAVTLYMDDFSREVVFDRSSLSEPEVLWFMPDPFDMYRLPFRLRNDDGSELDPVSTQPDFQPSEFALAPISEDPSGAESSEN